MTTKSYLGAEEVMARYGPLTLGAHLDFWRYSYDIPLADFARKLAISKTELRDIEKGRKLVSPAIAAKFARILGEDEDEYVALAVADSLRRDGLHYSSVRLVREAPKPKGRSRVPRHLPRNDGTAPGRQPGDHRGE